MDSGNKDCKGLQGRDFSPAEAGRITYSRAEFTFGAFPRQPVHRPRCPEFPSGFWTSDFEVYRRAVFAPGHIFYDDTICHFFASRAEGEAYLRGAGRQLPESR